MEEILINSLQGQGIWTVCCVILTVYVLRTSGVRETKLQDIIDKQADALTTVKEVKNDINSIKIIVENIK